MVDRERVLERAEWARSLQNNPLLEVILGEMRESVVQELLAAVPDNLTSVTLHAKLRAVDELPVLIQSAIDEENWLDHANRAKGIPK